MKTVYVVYGYYDRSNLGEDRDMWIEAIYLKETDAIERVKEENLVRNENPKYEFRYEEWEVR